MSSGASYSAAQGPEAEEPAVRWLPVSERLREETWDFHSALHWRVELPSRRMYLEAAGQPGLAGE